MTPNQFGLPKAYSSFIGRRGEVAQIAKLLSTTRLLTLTGPGGSGKSRLALQSATELASEFGDSVYWADLAPLSDPSYVPQAVAALLGRSEQPGRSSVEGMIELLRRRKVLLILDNCEHVLDACAGLASAILPACPNITLLATSLRPLGLPQEYVWQVPPLALTDPDTPVEELEESDSVQLFVVRAAEAYPGFALNAQNAPVVASICRCLDGLPLAIELAAARMKLLTVEQIANRLDGAITLLTHGKSDALPRHQALRATLDWTYQFLNEAEQTLLRRLSVFAGLITLEMVESVCAIGETEKRREGEAKPFPAPPPLPEDVSVALSPTEVLDLLTGLVEKSFIFLLPREGQTESGYRLLEVIRQYAREKLEASGQSAAIRNSYLDWSVDWAVRAEPHLTRPEQIIWLKKFEWNQEHFRACLRWACTSQRVEQGLRLAVALSRFWLTGGMEEGRGWLEELLNLEPSRRESGLSPVSPETRAWALCMSGRLAVRQGDDDHGKRRGEESLLLFRAAEDKLGIVTALNLLALVAQDTAEYPLALALYQEALNLSRESDNPRMTGVLLNNQGLLYYEQQDYRRVAPLWEEAHAIGTRLNFYSSLDNLGCLAMMQGDLSRAQELLEKECQTMTQTGDKHGLALAIMDLGEACEDRATRTAPNRCSKRRSSATSR